VSFLDKIITGPVKHPRRTLVYGCHGDGKSTWASKWDKPLFLPTEDGTNDLEVDRLPLFKSSLDLVQAIGEVAGSDYETVVLDSIDWLEKLISEDLVRENFKTGYGQGAIEQARRIGIVLTALEGCLAAGKHVVLIGHAHQTTVTTPHGDAYTQWAPRLSKHSAAVVSEWVDEMVFTRQVVRSKVKEVGLRELRVAVDTGDRVLYTEGSTAFQAKHRHPNLKPQYNLSDVSSYLTDLGVK
jgi:hypothetical protein